MSLANGRGRSERGCLTSGRNVHLLASPVLLAHFATESLPVGVKLAAHLWERRRVIVTPIVHEEFRGLRVTPNVYTTLADVDAFADEMERVIGGAA